MLSRTAGSVAVRRRHSWGGRGGFTIVELMVALVIIGVVLAIVLPALSGARNQARRAATQADLSRLGQASSAYQIDNRRLPGYFSPRQMADPANGENSATGSSQRGFSAMQNIMLDLAGGLVPSTGASFGAGGEILEVGPVSGAGSTAYVNLSLIGSSQAVNGATRSIYFAPDRKQFVADQGIVTNVDNHRRLPNMMDAFGSPILAWASDEQTRDSIPPPPFASVQFNGPATGARYYWATNAAFLRSTALGAAQKSQVFASGAEEYSLIGAGRTDLQLTDSLAGLLGNAAYPTPDQTHPRIGRAPLIFHSAGTDGVFLNATDRGGKGALQSSSGIIRYSVNNEPLNNFDDVVGTAGN